MKSTNYLRNRSSPRQLVAAILSVCLWQSPAAVAQVHRDVQFSYIDGKIDVQPPSGSSALVFESEFPTSGIEQQFTTQPGFASETDVGLGIGAGDQIVYNVLDSLLFWDGSDFQPPSEGTQIRINHNPPSVPDTVVHSSSGEQPGGFSPPANRIGAAGSAGDFHSHLQFSLEPSNFPLSPPPPELGAYGVRLSLSTDAPGVVDSDPFFCVFNFGLDDATFDEALAAFTGLLSQPSSGDYNQNGIVDAADYVVWRNSEGQTGSGLAADGNRDMEVNHEDYEFWKIRFGNVASNASTASVPEPATSILAIVACVGLWFVVSNTWRIE